MRIACHSELRAQTASSRRDEMFIDWRGLNISAPVERHPQVSLRRSFLVLAYRVYRHSAPGGAALSDYIFIFFISVFASDFAAGFATGVPMCRTASHFPPLFAQIVVCRSGPIFGATGGVIR